MNRFGIGQPVRRIEDVRFVTGRGQYVADVDLPGMAHGQVLLSPYAHARIKEIDVPRARDTPGVICVLTGKRCCRISAAAAVHAGGHGRAQGLSRYSAGARSRRGQARRVAFVVAETAAQARDLELIEVTYESLPAVTDLVAAAEPDAPQCGTQRPEMSP